MDICVLMPPVDEYQQLRSLDQSGNQHGVLNRQRARLKEESRGFKACCGGGGDIAVSAVGDAGR